MKIKFLITTLLFLMSGCVTVTKKADLVQVHNQMSNFISGCKRIGPAKGVGKSMLSAEQAVEAAKVNLRENTVDLGGDTVVILDIDNLLNIVTFEAHMQGIAFKCN